jgi:hypothetical protein
MAESVLAKCPKGMAKLEFGREHLDASDAWPAQRLGGFTSLCVVIG